MQRSHRRKFRMLTADVENIYLTESEIRAFAIMKVTGHKTEREFMKYIKITEEQTALELMSHPCFSGKQANE